MPHLGQLEGADEYYSTLFHEFWSTQPGTAGGLNRFAEAEGYQVVKYSFEELVAELGAAFLCAFAGLKNPGAGELHRRLAKVFRQDSQVLARAASAAQKAVDSSGEPCSRRQPARRRNGGRASGVEDHPNPPGSSSELPSPSTPDVPGGSGQAAQAARLAGCGSVRPGICARRGRTRSRSWSLRRAAFGPGRPFNAEDAARRQAPSFALLHDPPHGLLRQTDVQGVQAAAVDDDLVGLEPQRDPGRGELDALKQVVRKEEPILGAIEPNPKRAILRRERLIQAGDLILRIAALR